MNFARSAKCTAARAAALGTRVGTTRAFCAQREMHALPGRSPGRRPRRKGEGNVLIFARSAKCTAARAKPGPPPSEKGRRQHVNFCAQRKMHGDPGAARAAALGASVATTRAFCGLAAEIDSNQNDVKLPIDADYDIDQNLHVSNFGCCDKYVVVLASKFAHASKYVVANLCMLQNILNLLHFFGFLCIFLMV